MMKKLLLLSLLVLFGCSKGSEEEASGVENVDFFEMVNGKIFIPTSPNLEEGDDDYYGVLVKFAESYNCGDKIGPVDACGSLIGGLFIKRLLKFTGFSNSCETQTFNNYRDYTFEEITNGVKYDFTDNSDLVASLTSFSFPLKVTVRQYGKTFTYEEITEDESRSRIGGLNCSNQQVNRFYDD